MKRCFIVCNIENKKTNNIVFSWVGSNMSTFLATAVSDLGEYRPVILNIGAPHRFAKSMAKTKVDTFDNYDIVEFKSSFSFLLNRFRAKVVIKNAFKYLLNEFKDGDAVIIYHSLSCVSYYQKTVTRCGKDNSILFTAEVYNDVSPNGIVCKDKEVNSFLPFKKFIVMSKGIKEVVLSVNKKANVMLLYGVLKSSSVIDNHKTSVKNKEQTIHLVYSGTTSKEKNGLYMALEAMEYLPDNYLLHVFCDNRDQYALEEIKKTRNTVYEGYVSESELLKNLSMYDIGLASQNPYLPFNKTSFPSKIVTYLLSGLCVVSSLSESVISSPFAKIVTFFEYNPKSLASKIVELSPNISTKGNTKYLSSIYQDCLNELRSLIKNNENTRD